MVGTSPWNDKEHGGTGFAKSHIKCVFLKVTGGNKGFADTVI